MKNIIKISCTLLVMFITTTVKAQDAKHSVGSEHKFKVNVDAGSGKHLTDHVGNTYTWKIFAADGKTLATNLDYTFNTAADGVDVNTVDIQWLQTGRFFVELTEKNIAGACTTLRRLDIEVSATDIDLALFASNDKGIEIDGLNLVDCNDNSGAIIDNTTSDFKSSVRYFTVKMTTDGQEFTIGEWGFDIASLAGATITASNGATVVANKVLVPAGKSETLLTVVVANTPGISPDKDILLNVEASGAYISTVGGQTLEMAAKLTNNKSSDFTIKASPNTSVITID